jgi:hypothetical protein
MPSLREAQRRIAKYYLDTAWNVDGLYKQGGDALASGLTLFDSMLLNALGASAERRWWQFWK